MMNNSRFHKYCLPFSFRMNGKNSDDFLGSWEINEAQYQTSKYSVTEVEFKDPVSKLSVFVKTCHFNNSSASEQKLYFTNNGITSTPSIEEVFPVTQNIEIKPDDRAYLHHAKGSTCVIDDFMPLLTELGHRYSNSKKISPKAGRSSDGTLPFMTLQLPGGGLTIAVGWTGQWFINFERDSENIALSTGIENIHLKLEPGETISTPRILLIEWEGDDSTIGSNQLRKLLLEHYIPRLKGELTIPPVSYNSMYSHWLDKSSLTFENEIKGVEKGSAIGVEAHWIDACWFGNGDWHSDVGDWRIRTEIFPDGLKPLSDVIHKKKMKFILWFEPERVGKNTPLAKEYPDWMLKSKDSGIYLLNFGIPEAREYITNVVSNYIDEFEVDIYRQDFNVAPLSFWDENDSPERAGITQIKYIEGLYKFWKDLCSRHPNLAIDNCASGGRRIDLETLSYSYPLWRSDYSDVECLKFPKKVKHVGAQCQTAGLSRWVPLHSAAVWSFTPYDFRSAMSTGIVVYPDIRLEDFSLEIAEKAINELKRLRPYFLGDFYPLLSLNKDFDGWCAYQYHCQDKNAGFALFFRRHESGFSTLEGINLNLIHPDKEYLVSIIGDEYVKDPHKKQITGKSLIEMTIIIKNKPGSALLEYQQL